MDTTDRFCRSHRRSDVVPTPDSCGPLGLKDLEQNERIGSDLSHLPSAKFWDRNGLTYPYIATKYQSCYIFMEACLSSQRFLYVYQFDSPEHSSLAEDLCARVTT